ncbi:MAG: RNA polymerase sigma factor [Faecalibacterium sp.]|nr:RNA polymerase sigma factor [Ruminococcus sp.]MCM1392187.1 RNA polymerase sigma factor [Ruminococcus sp.]MCM1485403.1 RNA polymerase sigma factor [Faecalibacterium sp.]
MSSNNIDVLINKAIDGDTDSFGELYSIFASDMYRFAYYYTSSKQLAEDAVGDAVLSAFQNIGKLKNSASFKPWLFKILFNCCKQKQKEKMISSNQTELSSIENTVSTQNDYSLHIDLRCALDALSDKEREIVILAFACKYKSEEIAQMLELNPNTVRSKLSRAAAKLRKSLT